MSYTSKVIFDALKHVMHPGENKDIISLNLVDDLKIEGKKISFNLIFTKPTDPFISSIKKACIQAILIYVNKSAKTEINIKTSHEIKKPLNKVKNIIAIASGKGGVGKSTIATNLAVALIKTGTKIGLIDADIYGPSVPKMFNVENTFPEVKKIGNKEVIFPVEKYGVKLLSIGFFVNPEDALIWRGPMATNALKQLINQTEWGELDYMLIDLPPGTSDIHLTLVQEVSVTGAIIVSTPQDVALADAVKGINMFQSDKINVPVLGLVENMSWFTPEELPGNKYFIFGKEGCKKLAEKLNVPLLGEIPIVQSICEGGDMGTPSALDENSVIGKAFQKLAEKVIREIDKRNVNLQPTKKVEVKRFRTRNIKK